MPATPRHPRLKRHALLLLAAGAALPALASEWAFEYKPATEHYARYGGGLGDPVAPSKNDTKLAFEVTGKAAKEIFDAIGPDTADACAATAEGRFRSRDKGKIACLRSKEGAYSCTFGFDLKSGQSIGGAIC